MDEERFDRKSLFSQGWNQLRNLAAQLLESKLDVLPRAQIRPPGALVESLFLATCHGTGECAKACPFGSIKLAGLAGMNTDATPMITPTVTACHACADVPCSKVCPSGALVPIQRSQLRIGEAVVNRTSCFAWQGEPCARCIDVCPEGSSAIRQEPGGGPVVITQGCTGCGLCTNECPSRPRSIRIRPR